MSEDPPTISGYMRQLADQVRVRWQRREPASHLALSPPVVPPATSNSAFPHLSEVQLQRLFGEESASTLARDVFNTLQEMESNESQRRGAWAIAEVLRRLSGPPERICASQQDTPQDDEDADYVAGMSDSRVRPIDTRRRTFAPHDVFAAIERNDVDRIMAIRDAHFELLLGVEQNEAGGQSSRTPLEYAINLGPKYHRVCLFLVGALSRYVNHIPDDHPPSDTQMVVLRKVRTNLKLAIDQSLLRNDTELIASYLQVLVMAEGTAWLSRSVKNVALEVEARAFQTLQEGGVVPQPIQTAQNTVSLFLTSHMRMRRQTEQVVVAAVDDYVANATGDLVLLALWSRLAPTPEDVPLYAFARDDRCTSLFLEFISAQRAAPPSGPAAKLWRLAERIETALQGGLHTPTAAERLTLLSKIFPS